MSNATPAAAGLAHERAALRTVARAVAGGRAVLVAAVCAAGSLLATPGEGEARAGSAR
jgi:hypothetical protein